MVNFMATWIIRFSITHANAAALKTSMDWFVNNHPTWIQSAYSEINYTIRGIISGTSFTDIYTKVQTLISEFAGAFTWTFEYS